MKRQKQTYPDARFWDRMADRYSKKSVPDQQVYAEKLAKTDRLLKPSDHVLEIGCGTGSTAIHHASQVTQIVAIDYSERMIEIARRKAREADINNAKFLVSTISDLPTSGEEYDVVLAHSVLHLVPDPLATLNTISQLLKPGGLFITTVPCIGEFFPLFRYINAIGKRLRLMPYVAVFKEAQFQRWLRDAKFTVEERWLPAPKSGLFLIARVGPSVTATDEQLSFVAR
ncbi:MAG: class I SAM-dependent methyltransferase [Pseudomonadota bacterium]